MSSQNPWVVLAAFAENLAPHAENALNAVAAVSTAVVETDLYLADLDRQSKNLLPPSN